MSSSFGQRIRVSIFGESHGEGIGVVIDGLPAGEAVDLEELAVFLNRRAPGGNALSTKRREADLPQFLSGIYGGKTSGSPLCAVIRNQGQRPGDYESLLNKPRPGHADYTARVKYGGQSDPRGGGHFSGRLTAPLCVAGGICRQILARRGVTVGAHIAAVGGIPDVPFKEAFPTAEEILAPGKKAFPTVDDFAASLMEEEILRAAKEGDSVGGVIECCVLGLPAGLGSPMFGGVENRFALAVFGIPAVKGVEFGGGFGLSNLRGSEANDPFVLRDGRVETEGNRCGGILGGITNGMPVVFRAAIKPTPSIAKEQRTVDLASGGECMLAVHGRHDPCIVPRAVPCVEAAAAVTALDLLLAGL